MVAWWLLLLFSLACLGLAGWLYIRARTFLEGAVTTVGIVTEVLREESVQTDNDGFRTTDTMFRPVVRFSTESGEQIEFASGVSTNPPSYRKGGQVPVAYDPSDPQKAKIKSFWLVWGFAVVAAGIGGVGLLMACVGLLK